MREHNLKYSEGISLQHSNQNQTNQPHAHNFVFNYEANFLACDVCGEEADAFMFPEMKTVTGLRKLRECPRCGLGMSDSHICNPPTTTNEVPNGRNREPHTGQGQILLSADERERVFRPQGQLLGQRSNESWYEGDLRSDQNGQGLGRRQRDESQDLNIDPTPTFGPVVNCLIAGAAVIWSLAVYGAICLGHQLSGFFTAVTR